MQSWPKLDPGEAIHQITIMQPSTVQDVSGTAIAFIPFVVAWAKIEPVRGIDVLKSGQDTSQLFITITIFWQAGILPNMQVQTVDGSTYVIRTVENPGKRNVILVLNCLGLGQNQ